VCGAATLLPPWRSEEEAPGAGGHEAAVRMRLVPARGYVVWRRRCRHTPERAHAHTHTHTHAHAHTKVCAQDTRALADGLGKG
jgi:hypothetical protein